MVARLGIVRAGVQPAEALAAWSREALDRPLRSPAELWLATCADAAIWLESFQRATALPAATPGIRRGSGGPEARIGPGDVHVALALASPSALVACDAARIVNRHVRPLLRALTRIGHMAHYFGRDWVSAGGGPAAWVGFAHDAHTGRTLFEALVPAGEPFAPAGRSSFRGKRPVALSFDPERLVAALADAYAVDAEVTLLELPPGATRAPEAPADPPWAATVEEAIGTLGAGRDGCGRFRIGGDLMVSRDALARLEQQAPTAGSELPALVDRTLGAPGVALEGVRSLASVRDVVAAALAQG